MKPVIVSVSSLGREDYRLAQLNLIDSCVNARWKGDYMMRSVDGYCNEYKGVRIELGSWPLTKKYGISWQHADMPYQFKPFAIQEALEAGYSTIIWMDSTCRMLKDPSPLLDIAKQRGVLTWNNLNYPVVNWTSDTAMKNLGETEQSLQGVKQIMACCSIWDFTNPTTQPIFDRWIRASMDNTFYPDDTDRPSFKGNRHDQAALSIILHQSKIQISDYGDGFCYYPNNENGEHTNGKEIFLINKGIK